MLMNFWHAFRLIVLMLQFLDIFLDVFHTGLVLFILLGWISSKAREAHFWVLTGTLIAWLIVGAWIGTIGYCPITDWQWDIKRALGETRLPSSFIKYKLDMILGTNLNRHLVDTITGIGMASVTLIAGWMRIKKSIKKEKEEKQPSAYA